MSSRWESGFDASGVGTATLTIQPGEAYISGYKVGKSTDSNYAGTVPGTDTHHVYLDKLGNIVINTTGSQPADSIKLYTVATTGGNIDSITSVRDETLRINAPFSTESIEVDGIVSASSHQISGTQPYIEIDDEGVGGDIFRLWNRNGKLQVTDASGATVYTDDLSDVFGGANYIQTSEKGAPNGVATLDAGGVHPAAQYRTATEEAKGAVQLANAVPAGLGTAAKGTSSRAAKADHVHPHGDVTAEGGTMHTMAQISGVIDDTKHGNRGGGALHAVATTSSAGFMSAADKTALDNLDTSLFIQKNGSVAFTGDQSMGGFKLTNLAAPVASTDAVRKIDLEEASAISDLFLLGGM